MESGRRGNLVGVYPYRQIATASFVGPRNDI